MSTFCNIERYHYSVRILIYCIILLLIVSLFRKNINLLYYINRCLNNIFSWKFESRLVLKPIVFIFSCSNNGIFAECQNIRLTKAFLLQVVRDRLAERELQCRPARNTQHPLHSIPLILGLA